MGFFKELFNFIAVLTEYGGLNLGPVAALLTPKGSSMRFSIGWMWTTVDQHLYQLRVNLALSLPM